MNNAINGYFSNPDISPKNKIPALVGLFCGDINKEKRPGNQDVIHCVVGKKGELTHVMIECGVNYSLSTGACVALLKNLSATDYFKNNADRILKGDCSDEEIVSNCKQEIRVRYNANDKLAQNKYKDSDNGVILGVRGKLERYFKDCVTCGDLTSEQMETSVKNLLDLVEKYYVEGNEKAENGDKKKQIMAEMPSNN